MTLVRPSGALISPGAWHLALCCGTFGLYENRHIPQTRESPLRRDRLIEYLHTIQDAEGCLPQGLLAALAKEMKLSQVEVFEVASFYHHFDLVADDEPRPPALTVRVCESLSCELAGAAQLIERLQTLVGAEVRVQPVPCVGRCAQAPVAVVGRLPLPQANVDSVMAHAKAGDRECALPTGQPAPGDRVEAIPEPPPGAWPVLQSLIDGAQPPVDVITQLESSALRGMGGAGFPAGRKWRIVAGFEGPRMLVVNADEGEPGTFKDRFWLECEPRRFLEGMLIAAWAVGCETCVIYLRDEYPGVRALLERDIAALQAAPPSGWSLPEIELRRGAGAYVCGEESALIESIEGKRGMPRLRPPYVAEVGLQGRPTLAHNVETLAWVPIILQQGAPWFAAQGRRGRKGLRSFSVSGRVREPGVKIAPAGISLHELINEYCGGMADGHVLAAFLPGGASGGILPASLADEPLDFDTLQPHGAFIGSAAVIVLSKQDDLRRAAQNLMRFFRLESCGQCTPCRVGTAKAVTLMEAPRWDEGRTICALGDAAAFPVMSFLKHFRSAFEHHIKHKTCQVPDAVQRSGSAFHRHPNAA